MGADTPSFYAQKGVRGGIPNLPGYIDQPTASMTSKVDSFNGYTKGYVERIRDHIPKEAPEEEHKALEYGSQQSLI